MVRFATRLAGLTFAALLVTAATAHAGARVYVGVNVGVPAPPAAVVVGAPVPYGYVYQPGYYMWTGYAYQYVPATYVRPPYAGAVWVAPRYVHGPRGAYYVRGYWRR